MSLNYKTYFRHAQKLFYKVFIKYFLYLRPFNVFSFKESSILTIKYVFSFFGSLTSCLQVIDLNSDPLRFSGSVDIGVSL